MGVSLSILQKLSIVGAFFEYYALGWAVSCGNEPECFWVKELRPVQL